MAGEPTNNDADPALTNVCTAADAFLGFADTIEQVLAALDAQPLVQEVATLNDKVLRLQTEIITLRSRVGADNPAFMDPNRRGLEAE